MRRPARLVVWFRVLLLLSMALGAGGPAAPAFARSLAGMDGGSPPLTVNTTQPAGVTPSGAGVGIPQGTPQEVPARRTANSQTFRVGTHYETRIYPGSVNYQDANGAWQPIDNTLVADSTAGYALTNKANRYQVHLPKTLGGGPVRVGEGKTWVQFALVGATAGAAVTAATATATYPDALPGVSVSYAAGNDRLQERLVLASATAPHSFVYTLQTQGLTAKADGHGGIAFLDSAGKVQLGFAPPSMQDSSKKPSGVSRAATLTLGTNATGQTVTLSADPTWLADPARVYPVTIDPTVYINAISFVGATADCLIVNGSDAGTSYCGQDPIYAGYDGANLYRTLLNFNIMGGYGTPFPSDFNVLEASVNLLLTAQDNPSSAPAMALQQVTQPWTTAATWNTADGSTPWTAPGGTYTASPLWTTDVGTQAGVFYQWYVTSLVQGWSNGQITNDGLELKEADEGQVNWVGFDSSEDATSANWPYLNIKWEPWLGAKGYSTLNSYGLTDRSGLGVNVANGNLLLRASDLAIAGTGLPLAVDRTYNNLSVLSWDVGNSWDLNTGSDIELVLNGDGQGDGADIYGADWGVFFPRNPDGSFTSPTGIDATLVKNGDGTYTLTSHGSGLRYHWPSGGGLMLSQSDKNGNTITYGYNSAGNMISLTDTQGRVTTFAHTSPYSSGLITAMTDPAGRTWQYAYDANKNLTQYTDPNNKVTQYAYDGSNELVQITDPDGNVTKLAYDGANTYRVTSVTLAAGSAVQAVYRYTYNTGNTVATDPNNHQTTYYYDYLGRVTKVVDAAGDSFQTSWTADSHPATTTDAYGKATTYGYDANNNPNQVALPTGATTRAVFGTVANIPYFYVPTSSTDAQGNTTSYGYDGNGNPTTVTDALASQNQTQYFYNANGTVDHVVDPRGNTTSYTYDGKGNLTTVTPPAPIGATTIAPDALSRPSSVTDGKGQKTSYTYDPLDRVTLTTYADNSTITAGYDADGNQTSMVDNTGTTSTSYDAQNRETQKVLPGNRTVSYGYDAVGDLTALTDSGGTVGYAYNAVNLPVTLTEPGGAQTTFGYDANGQRTGTTFAGGVVQSETYDASGRLVTISAKTPGGTPLTGFTYSYQKPGGGDGMLVSSITDSVDLTTTTQQYDKANRLTSWVVTPGSGSTFPALNYQYTFDGDGNRTSINANGTVTTLAYNAANEWTTATSGGKTANYSYDANGNETGNDGFGDPTKALTITYNAKNQTASMTDSQQNVIPFAYTGPGQAERTSAGWAASNPATPNGPATYTYGSGLLNATDNAGTAYYTRDPGGTLVSQRLPNGTVYHYLMSGDGSVVRLVDPSGNVVATYHYCPTGNKAVPDSGPAAAGNPYQQFSLLHDAATDTNWLGGLPIDPESGNASKPQFCLILGGPFSGLFGFLCPRTLPFGGQQQAQTRQPTRFRVQLQVSPIKGGVTLETYAQGLTDSGSGRGVTAAQVSGALASFSAFVPASLADAYNAQVVAINGLLDLAVAGGGVSGNWRRTFPFAEQNRKVWRIDLENLSGTNLRYAQ